MISYSILNIHTEKMKLTSSDDELFLVFPNKNGRNLDYLILKRRQKENFLA